MDLAAAARLALSDPTTEPPGSRLALQGTTSKVVATNRTSSINLVVGCHTMMPAWVVGCSVRVTVVSRAARTTGGPSLHCTPAMVACVQEGYETG